MEAILNVVLPVFGIILAGYVAGRLGLLGEASSEALNRFVYYVALPTLLFYSMARVEPAEIFNWPFIAAWSAGLTVTFALALVVSRLVFRRRLAEAALFAMAAIFGNTGYMGIPLAITAFGDAGALPAIIATVVQSTVFVAVTAALIEADLNRGAGRAMEVLRALARNPLIFAPVAGIAWSVLGPELPGPIDAFCRILAPAAGPSALFAIGLFMIGKPIRRGAAEVASATVIKLLVQPAVTWWLVVAVLDVEPAWAVVAVVMAALPTGINAFVLAQQYGLWVRRASAVILVSTVVSVLTLSLLFTFWSPMAGME